MTEDAKTIQTTVRLSRESWVKGRRLAEDEALERGGRPSMSSTIEGLINRAIHVHEPKGEKS